jgi:Helix-turn-helix domain
MAQFYTLEEAARVLGVSPDELKHKAQSREVRAFMDSGSWRFRVADIDELARRRGMGSDPDLSLSDLELEVPKQSGSASEELMLSEFQLGVANPDLGPPSLEVRAGDHDILMDESALPPNPVGGSSSVILGMGQPGKMPSDSDVRLVPDNTKGASDSDVRLGAAARPSDSNVKAGPKKPGKPSDSDVKVSPKRVPPPRPSDSDVTLVSDDAPGFGSSDDMPIPKGRDKRRPGSSAMIGSSGEVPAGESDSDFELTPSSVIDALQPESGSDFELTALDASDEFESTPGRGPSDSDVTAAEPAASGINLGKPSDSGINLQNVGSFDLESADSIELAPLDDDEATAKSKASAKSKTPQKPSKPDLGATALPGKGGKVDLSATALPTKGGKVDLSATALPIKGAKADLAATSLPMKGKGKGEKDIFEDTDFEVDAVDSSEDRTVQLEAASDFDIDESESASEVFALDEDEVDQNAATAMAPALMDEEGSSGDEPISGETPSAWEVDSDTAPAAASSRAPSPSPMLASSGAQAEWGGLTVGMLIGASVLVLFCSFVGLDLIRNLYDFRGDVPVTSGLVKAIAGMFGS